MWLRNEYRCDSFVVTLLSSCVLLSQKPLHKILVIRLSSIGDIVLTTPFLRRLNARFPDCEMHYVVRKEYASLLREHPKIARLFELDTSKGTDELRKLRRTLCNEGYDAVFDLHNNFRSRFLCRNIHAPRHIIRKRTFKRFLLVHFKWNFFRTIVPVPERYIETAAVYGVTPDNEGCDLFVPSDVLENVKAKLVDRGWNPERRLIAIAPGSKHFTKRWPAEKFNEVMRLLMNNTGANILILGSSEDKIHTPGNERVMDFCGEFSLTETIAALRLASLVICNDSGLMHAATSQGAPVLALFGSTVREFGFFPYHARSRVLEIEGLACRPCSHVGRASCPEKHFRCMNDISPQKVFSIALEMLNEIS